MRRFRLNLFLAMGIIVVATAVAVMMLEAGKWAQTALAIIAAGCGACWLLQLVRRLIRVMATFLKAMEVNDVTIKINVGDDDRELRRMSQTMNKIITAYRHNIREVQTSKLYYDRILRVMTHEMRNAITPVIAISSDFMKSPGTIDGETLEEGLSIIRQQSGGIKRFLDAYYNLTHVGEPSKERIKAATFFEMIRPLAAIETKDRNLDDSTVSFSVAKDMELEIDVELMTRVMVNLIRNALDSAMNSGSPKVEVASFSSQGVPTITVTDNGPGIDSRIREQLFEPFVSSKKEGSGVGLTLSRQIARRHGGDLTLCDASPHGAIARISL